MDAWEVWHTGVNPNGSDTREICKVLLSDSERKDYVTFLMKYAPTYLFNPITGERLSFDDFASGNHANTYYL